MTTVVFNIFVVNNTILPHRIVNTTQLALTVQNAELVFMETREMELQTIAGNVLVNHQKQQREFFAMYYFVTSVIQQVRLYNFNIHNV